MTASEFMELLTSQGFIKEVSEVEDPKNSLLMVDKRVFGGKHFNNMKDKGEDEVTEDDSVEAYLKEKLVQITRPQEELEEEKKSIGKLLLSLHQRNVAGDVTTSATVSKSGGVRSGSDHYALASCYLFGNLLSKQRRKCYKVKCH